MKMSVLLTTDEANLSNKSSLTVFQSVLLFKKGVLLNKQPNNSGDLIALIFESGIFSSFRLKQLDQIGRAHV